MKKLSRADKIKAQLDAQISVNRINADKISDYYKRLEANLPAPVKDVASELADEQDIAVQREKALKILRVLVKKRDVNTVLFKLQEDGQLKDFNKYAGGFINELSIKTDLSAALFAASWARYVQKLLITDNTGIAIPPTRREYAAEFLDLANELKGLPSKLSYEFSKTLPAILAPPSKPTGIKTGVISALPMYIKPGEELITYINMDAETLNKAFQQTAMASLGVAKSGDLVGKKITVPGVENKTQKEVEIKPGKGGLWSPSNAQKVRYILSEKHGIFIPYQLNTTDLVSEGNRPKVLRRGYIEEEEEEKKSLTESILDQINKRIADDASIADNLAYLLNAPSGVTPKNYLDSLNDVQKDAFLKVLKGEMDPSALPAPFNKTSSPPPVIPPVPGIPIPALGEPPFMSARRKEIEMEKAEKMRSGVERVKLIRAQAERKSRIEAEQKAEEARLRPIKEEEARLEKFSRPIPQLVIRAFNAASPDEQASINPIIEKFGGRYTLKELFTSPTLLTKAEIVKTYLLLGGDEAFITPLPSLTFTSPERTPTVSPREEKEIETIEVPEGVTIEVPEGVTPADLINMVSELSAVNKALIDREVQKSGAADSISSFIIAVQSSPDSKEKQDMIDGLYQKLAYLIQSQELTESETEERRRESVGSVSSTEIPVESELTEEQARQLDIAIEAFNDLSEEKKDEIESEYITDYSRDIPTILRDVIVNDPTLFNQIVAKIKSSAGSGLYVGRGFRYNAKINQSNLRRMNPKSTRIGEGLKSDLNKSESNKDIKRFELLKAHILAGNDNPKVIKECIELYKRLTHNYK